MNISLHKVFPSVVGDVHCICCDVTSDRILVCGPAGKKTLDSWKFKECDHETWNNAKTQMFGFKLFPHIMILYFYDRRYKQRVSDRLMSTSVWSCCSRRLCSCRWPSVSCSSSSGPSSQGRRLTLNNTTQTAGHNLSGALTTRQIIYNVTLPRDAPTVLHEYLKRVWL